MFAMFLFFISFTFFIELHSKAIDTIHFKERVFFETFTFWIAKIIQILE